MLAGGCADAVAPSAATRPVFSWPAGSGAAVVLEEAAPEDAPGTTMFDGSTFGAWIPTGSCARAGRLLAGGAAFPGSGKGCAEFPGSGKGCAGGIGCCNCWT